MATRAESADAFPESGCTWVVQESSLERREGVLRGSDFRKINTFNKGASKV
jgi:hypothetical protein